MLPTEGFLDPHVAWSLVLGTVALGAGLLGFLHQLVHPDERSTPEGDEPTRWRDAA